MRNHQEIHDALYGYLAGELDPATRAEIESHLPVCPECRQNMATLREAMALLPQSRSDPADARSAEFWQEFPFRVEHAIRMRANDRRHRFLPHLRDSLLSFAVMRKGQIALGGVAMGLCAIALALMLRPTPPPVASGPSHEPPAPVAEERPTIKREEALVPGSAVPAASPRSASGVPVTRAGANRVSDYFRKSKILLIGVANLKEDPDAAPDLSTERSVSRSLVKEARYIKKEPGLNPKARALIDELNRVLIQLANLSEQNDPSGIEIIRGGIRQENLLFKIRMAENAMSTVQPTPSSTKKVSSPL